MSRGPWFDSYVPEELHTSQQSLHQSIGSSFSLFHLDTAHPCIALPYTAARRNPVRVQWVTQPPICKDWSLYCD